MINGFDDVSSQTNITRTKKQTKKQRRDWQTNERKPRFTFDSLFCAWPPQEPQVDEGRLLRFEQSYDRLKRELRDVQTVDCHEDVTPLDATWYEEREEG